MNPTFSVAGIIHQLVDAPGQPGGRADAAHMPARAGRLTPGSSDPLG